jgi:predicted ribosomally synthesized peptide with SipW-like signal peptide
MNLRKTAALLAAAGLTAGLVGAGVSASWTDSATAAGTFTVGTLHCAVSSTDPSAVVSGNSVTITAPPITSSAAGNYLTSMTITNTGSITEVVSWTEATSGTLPANRWQPTGPMGYATGAGSDLLSTNLTLAGGASHTYANGIGFQWANADPVGGTGV